MRATGGGGASPDRRHRPEHRRDLDVGGRRITDLQTHPHPWITLEELGTHLGFDRRTLEKFIRAGVLPAHQFGVQWRIETAKAVKFVEAARFRPTEATTSGPPVQVAPGSRPERSSGTT